MELRICHLYPEVLNLYGDRGNIKCMQKRLAWRGIDSTVTRVGIGDRADLSQFDLFFIGGGQDFEQEVLLADLRQGKDREIKAAIEDGRTFLTICGGYQMLGNYYETHDGVRNEFLGAIDFYTVGGDVRMIDNYAFRLDPKANPGMDRIYAPGSAGQGGRMASVSPADSLAPAGKKPYTPGSGPRGEAADPAITVVGFENHSGKTYLGSGVQPLGRVIRGGGNNGEDGTEGVRCHNVFGSYSHGPILPKNPAFADYLLQTALERRYGKVQLEPLEDRFEKEAHDSVLTKVLAGTTGNQD